jgi:hypothetical protein
MVRSILRALTVLSFVSLAACSATTANDSGANTGGVGNTKDPQQTDPSTQQPEGRDRLRSSNDVSPRAQTMDLREAREARSVDVGVAMSCRRCR